MTFEETFATLAEYLRFTKPELSKTVRVVCLEFQEPEQASYVRWLLHHAIAGVPCPARDEPAKEA